MYLFCVKLEFEFVLCYIILYYTNDPEFKILTFLLAELYAVVIILLTLIFGVQVNK